MRVLSRLELEQILILVNLGIKQTSMITAQAYTPEQVAEILQLSKNTVYDLIDGGESIAKRFGRVYRIPPSSLSFVFTGLDYDLFKAETQDLKNIEEIQEEIARVRKSL